MVNIADAVRCDSEPRWQFRKLVADYLASHREPDLELIKVQLQIWKDNEVKFNALAGDSPYLQQITDLSNNLSSAGGIGLQALKGESNKDELMKQLKLMEKPSHEVQLTILPEIEALITGKLSDDPASYPLF